MVSRDCSAKLGWRQLLVASCLFLWVSPLLASDASVSLALFWKNDNFTNNSANPATETDLTEKWIDFAFDYKISGNVLLGLIYSTEEWSLGNTTYNRTSLGVGGGYASGSWKGMAYYFLNSEYDKQGTVESGTGFQLDVRYFFKLTGDLEGGPMLAYKKFMYDEIEPGIEIDYEYTDIIPMLILQVAF